mmetsp:Transcript_12734/g.51151  ORF Transcript_12734/g.51151 Transcript_12734/m.51151 type:complete len:368 (+) Transcript_12734:584-1687(+)
MTPKYWSSTPRSAARCASSTASLLAPTPKASTRAFLSASGLTAATAMSDLVTSPTPEYTMFASTRDTSSSTSRPRSADSTASTEPAVSALTRTVSSRRSLRPRAAAGVSPERSKSAETRDADCLRNAAARSSWEIACRASATFRAASTSGATTNESPAAGILDVSDCQPTTRHAVEGPASSTGAPVSSKRARTRPNATPAANGSPTLRRPRRTKVVATTPKPFSTCASTTVPDARIDASALALRSKTSAWRSTFSRRSSMPSPVLAETRANMVSPPNSSGTKSYDMSSDSTRPTSAPSTSILLTATTTGTRAAFAHAIESTVCALTPSSAATTRMTRSVQFAPRDRISLNAACPGVSRNVIFDTDAS